MALVRPCTNIWPTSRSLFSNLPVPRSQSSSCRECTQGFAAYHDFMESPADGGRPPLDWLSPPLSAIMVRNVYAQAQRPEGAGRWRLHRARDHSSLLFAAWNRMAYRGVAAGAGAPVLGRSEARSGGTRR